MKVDIGYACLRWGYEQAFAKNIILKFDRDLDWNLVEIDLARIFGRGQDNKVTYCMLSQDGHQFFITFHDNTVYIGTDIRSYGSNGLPDGEKRKDQQ